MYALNFRKFFVKKYNWIAFLLTLSWWRSLSLVGINKLEGAEKTINPSRSDPGRREKINLIFIFTLSFIFVFFNPDFQKRVELFLWSDFLSKIWAFRFLLRETFKISQRQQSGNITQTFLEAATTFGKKKIKIALHQEWCKTVEGGIYCVKIY